VAYAAPSSNGAARGSARQRAAHCVRSRARPPRNRRTARARRPRPPGEHGQDVGIERRAVAGIGTVATSSARTRCRSRRQHLHELRQRPHRRVLDAGVRLRRRQPAGHADPAERDRRDAVLRHSVAAHWHRVRAGRQHAGEPDVRLRRERAPCLGRRPVGEDGAAPGELKVDVPKNISLPGGGFREFAQSPVAHGFPDVIDNYADMGSQYTLSNGATLYQVAGSQAGVVGRFEWIVDNGVVTHRMFVGGGSINGLPIVP
jgi:hypothetical protein